MEDKNRKTKTKPDFVLGRKKFQAELLPPALIIRRCFADQQAAVEALEADLAVLQRQMEDMAEEHAGEEGLLADAVNDKGKLTKASVMDRISGIDDDIDAADERNALSEYLALVEKELAMAAKLSAAQRELTEQVAAKYSKLAEEEIRSLVLDYKWLATLAHSVQGELDLVAQALTGRLRELAERYATPMPQLAAEVTALASRVDEHLMKIEAAWK